MFTASRLQTATYLLAVCPFSIAFLVFINSSVSFVVTDLIDLPSGEGDAVGTLGFADELLAVLACPIWGIVSDHIGIRYVCAAGYAIIALALALFVQSKNVYPQLLLGRLLFSLGGSAVSTMVTAILPSVTAARDDSDPRSPSRTSRQSEASNGDESRRNSAHTCTLSISSELTITPVRFRNNSPEQSRAREEKPAKASSSRLAGFVGMFTGCGALLALVIFLPLPAHFEKAGSSSSQSVKYAYYVVAAIALAISLICYVGFRNLQGEEGKGCASLRRSYSTGKRSRIRARRESSGTLIIGSEQKSLIRQMSPLPYFKEFGFASFLGFQESNITLGYVGGFVARSSSVGISLFVPLFVNNYYRKSGLCNQPSNHASVFTEPDLGDIKKSCREAYVLASILTGTSQLVALLCAPIFGYLSDKSHRYHFPLLFAAFAGILGYVLLALLPSPRYNGPSGSFAVFLAMLLMGVSQIGAIVCSLGVLSDGVLQVDPNRVVANVDDSEGAPNTTSTVENAGRGDETSTLLPRSASPTKKSNLTHLKGSIAGVYSLYGAVGILLLTKLGGLLFDTVSPSAPFYILAIFNGILLVVGIFCGLVQKDPSSRASFSHT
ncbi:hypothetical protein FQN54_003355 [Arachnomyces sp. PD_36]|nr:hypothetical protein FQN54_003355 [Arachnomyces sp. PD_36]